MVKVTPTVRAPVELQWRALGLIIGVFTERPASGLPVAKRSPTSGGGVHGHEAVESGWRLRGYHNEQGVECSRTSCGRCRRKYIERPSWRPMPPGVSRSPRSAGTWAGNVRHIRARAVAARHPDVRLGVHARRSPS